MKSIKFLMLTFIVCLATVNVMAQAKSAAQQAPMPSQGIETDKLLSLGDFYYRSNDVTDAADRYYRQAIRSAPGSAASGFAQYNRGNYWFRKFYLVRELYSKEDYAALTEAEAHYYDFIDKFAKETNTVGLLSDAEFYLALVYLQQGKRDYAIGWLNRLLGEAVSADPSIYVYKVVWSSKPGDIVDRKVDAAKLATFARQAIERSDNFESVVSEIKHWCKKQ